MAMTTWDPDGAGPQAEVLVGNIIDPASSFGSSVGYWDGNSWHLLGNSISGNVYAFTVYKGELIAGGNFNINGGNVHSLARWDGTSWQQLGSGVNGNVYALAVYDGHLIAGGYFSKAGGVNSNNIAGWDGTNWEPLSSGASGTVYALAIYNGELAAGGYFETAGGVYASCIARWNGATWQAFGSGIGMGISSVKGLCVYNDQLIASSVYSYSTGWPKYETVQTGTISLWNGSDWQRIGTASGKSDSGINSMASHNGELIVGGSFTTINSLNASCIAKWNGSIWTALGSGTSNTVNALTIFKGELIAGGRFASYAACWKNSNWYPLGNGMDGPVYALSEYENELIAGGAFKAADGNIVNCIAKRVGDSWKALGSGMSNTP